jgi:hypothetical protein
LMTVGQNQSFMNFNGTGWTVVQYILPTSL